MDQASTFLSATILITIGTIIICAGIVVINNILHKYWKPVTLLKWQDYYNPPRFASQEELDRLTSIQADNKKDKTK